MSTVVVFLSSDQVFCFAAIDLKKASNAIISSPGFPGKYPRNSYFTWSVVAPSGFRIKIEFLKLNIILTSDCSQDALVVREGPSVKSKELKRICGHRYSGNSNVLYSSSNTLTLEFVSALFGSHDSFGFEARISKGEKTNLRFHFSFTDIYIS